MKELVKAKEIYDQVSVLDEEIIKLEKIVDEVVKKNSFGNIKIDLDKEDESQECDKTYTDGFGKFIMFHAGNDTKDKYKNEQEESKKRRTAMHYIPCCKQF